MNDTDKLYPNEDFVNFDTAKRLKEEGFDWICSFVFAVDGSRTIQAYGNHNQFPEHVSTPTLTQAAKWLREVKKIDIIVSLEDDTEDPYQVEAYEDDEYILPRWENSFFVKYEEALVAGVKLVLDYLANKD